MRRADRNRQDCTLIIANGLHDPGKPSPMPYQVAPLPSMMR
jgi:hypothetical protein